MIGPQQTLESDSSDMANAKLGPISECDIVAVAKRRDGGTRYWCRRHKASATAKYGKRAHVCRAAHIADEPVKIFDVNLDLYEGGIALWGAVPAVYDTTRLPMD